MNEIKNVETSKIHQTQKILKKKKKITREIFIVNSKMSDLIATKVYFPFPKAPGLKPLHQMV